MRYAILRRHPFALPRLLRHISHAYAAAAIIVADHTAVTLYAAASYGTWRRDERCAITPRSRRLYFAITFTIFI